MQHPSVRSAAVARDPNNFSFGVSDTKPFTSASSIASEQKCLSTHHGHGRRHMVVITRIFWRMMPTQC